MVLFPSLHFIAAGVSPLIALGSQKYSRMSVPKLTVQMSDVPNLMSASGFGHSRFLTASAIFRGCLSTNEVANQMLAVQQKTSPYFVEWIPKSIKTFLCDIPLVDLEMPSTFIGNSTVNKLPFKLLH
ncbi:Tubulin/FtsZ [Pilobolus umbonatus]|nr:Tubulin/FtsZ [Pilobolus umbonatus]